MPNLGYGFQLLVLQLEEPGIKLKSFRTSCRKLLWNFVEGFVATESRGARSGAGLSFLRPFKKSRQTGSGPFYMEILLGPR